MRHTIIPLIGSVVVLSVAAAMLWDMGHDFALSRAIGIFTMTR